MASLFTPFVSGMQPKGIVQGQFGNNPTMMGSQQKAGNMMNILQLIKKLRGDGGQEDELTRHLEEIHKANQVSGTF